GRDGAEDRPAVRFDDDAIAAAVAAFARVELVDRARVLELHAGDVGEAPRALRLDVEHGEHVLAVLVARLVRLAALGREEVAALVGDDRRERARAVGIAGAFRRRTCRRRGARLVGEHGEPEPLARTLRRALGGSRIALLAGRVSL